MLAEDRITRNVKSKPVRPAPGSAAPASREAALRALFRVPEAP